MKQNLEITKGLAFSQRVMLALIDKGLSRQKAYELTQRNAMKTWKGKKSFLTQLKADSDVMAILPQNELEAIFDYQYYLRYVDEIFKRLGLTESQWKANIAADSKKLAPRSI